MSIVCLYTTCMPDAKRGPYMPWNCSHRWLSATMWLPGTKLRSSGSADNALNQSLLSSPSNFIINLRLGNNKAPTQSLTSVKVTRSPCGRQTIRPAQDGSGMLSCFHCLWLKKGSHWWHAVAVGSASRPERTSRQSRNEGWATPKSRLLLESFPRCSSAFLTVYSYQNLIHFRKYSTIYRFVSHFCLKFMHITCNLSPQCWGINPGSSYAK